MTSCTLVDGYIIFEETNWLHLQCISLPGSKIYQYSSNRHDKVKLETAWSFVTCYTTNVIATSYYSTIDCYGNPKSRNDNEKSYAYKTLYVHGRTQSKHMEQTSCHVSGRKSQNCDCLICSDQRENPFCYTRYVRARNFQSLWADTGNNKKEMRDLWEGRESLCDTHCLKMAGKTSEKLNCSSYHKIYLFPHETKRDSRI